jgi:uncharacterized UPF0160 family protein
MFVFILAQAPSLVLALDRHLNFTDLIYAYQDHITKKIRFINFTFKVI